MTGSFEELPHEEQLRRLHALAETALARYDLPQGSAVDMINLSENATYKVTTPDNGPTYALRVHRDRPGSAR